MEERTWEEMSLARLRAAKALLDLGFYRDSISRSYYAAYYAATSAVVGRNVTFAYGRQNPSHEQLPDLILNSGSLPKFTRRKVKTRLYFLRFTRENADYRLYAPINRALALECIYNAVSIPGVIGDNTTMKQTKKFIAQKVRERLAELHPGGVTLEVLEANIHKIDKWWRVPVRPNVWPKRLSDYYETLAELADELQESDHIDVIFFTGAPADEEQEAQAA